MYTGIILLSLIEIIVSYNPYESLFNRWYAVQVYFIAYLYHDPSLYSILQHSSGLYGNDRKHREEAFQAACCALASLAAHVCVLQLVQDSSSDFESGKSSTSDQSVGSLEQPE